jgi:hypothetical protein
VCRDSIEWTPSRVHEWKRPFWVQSLTTFKKHFFGIEDKLSFERAFYIKDLHRQMPAKHPILPGSRTRHCVLHTHADDPAYKCLLRPTRMRASTQGKQRQDLAAQLVARLLFVYKAE